MTRITTHFGNNWQNKSVNFYSDLKTIKYLRSQIKWTRIRVVQTKDLRLYDLAVTVTLNTTRSYPQITTGQDKGKSHEKK